MALTIEEAALLAQLETAYADLISGKLVASVTAHGRRVDYAAADVTRLCARIDELKGRRDARRRRSRGAIGFRF